MGKVRFSIFYYTTANVTGKRHGLMIYFEIMAKHLFAFTGIVHP